MVGSAPRVAARRPAAGSYPGGAPRRRLRRYHVDGRGRATASPGARSAVAAAVAQWTPSTTSTSRSRAHVRPVRDRSVSPLYPALIATVLALIGRSTDIGAATFVGFVISNVALAVALAYVFALVARDMGVSTARRAVFYVLIFPTTLFLSAVYAEALFLATGVASLTTLERASGIRRICRLPGGVDPAVRIPSPCPSPSSCGANERRYLHCRRRSYRPSAWPRI